MGLRADPLSVAQCNTHTHTHTPDRFQIKSLLAKEHAAVLHQQHKDFSHSQNLTLNLDGWSTSQMASWFASTAITPERKVHVLGINDVSEHSHTAEVLMGKCKHAPLARVPAASVPCAMRAAPC